MQNMTERERIQTEAIQSWVNNNKKGTIILVTGTGKTFIGVSAVGMQLNNNKIKNAAVIVPTVNLVQQWQEEFNK